MTHVCKTEGHGMCSWAATPAGLTALGFAVEVVDTILGTKVVVVEGAAFHEAKHAAWAAGAVRLCTKFRSGRHGLARHAPA